RERVSQRVLAVSLVPGGCVAKGHVCVQRCVLEPCRGLDRGDDLPGDAQLGETPERGLLVRAIVSNRLVEADHPLLDEIVAVAAGEEVRARLEPDEALVALEQLVECCLAAVASLEDELEVFQLSLHSLGGLRSCGGSSLHRIPQVRWACLRRPTSPP